MRYITIPEDIKLGNDGEKDVYQSFVAWLANPLNGKQFGADGKTLRMAVKIELRFENKEVGDVVPLSDDEWETLRDSAENPEGGFITAPAKIFIPFMDAVSKAAEEEPTKVE